MPLIHLTTIPNDLDKFIFFEETDITKVHNEVIKYNTNMLIDVYSVEAFLKTLIGQNEYNQLAINNKNGYLRIHGECKNLTVFKQKSRAKNDFPNSDIRYQLCEIGLDIDSRGKNNSLGNIEMKYADQNYIQTNQGKMIVLNLHFDNHQNFKNINKLLKFLSQQCLKDFYLIPKIRITSMEQMTILNFPSSYDVAQKSIATFEKIKPLVQLKNYYESEIRTLKEQGLKQEQKIASMENVKSLLTHFFATKIKFVGKDQQDKEILTVEVSEKDLFDFGQQVSECKIQ